MKNDALAKLGSDWQGTYEFSNAVYWISNSVNGTRSWVSTTNSKAIWYYQLYDYQLSTENGKLVDKLWAMGEVETSLGASVIGSPPYHLGGAPRYMVPIYGDFNSEYDGEGLLDSRTVWNYWDGSNVITANATDFQVECSSTLTTTGYYWLQIKNLKQKI